MRIRKAVCGVAVALTVVGSLVTVSAPAGAASDPGAEGDFIARTNALRSSKGLAPLNVNGTLTAKARAWAEHMAAVGGISHSNLPDGAPSEWQRLGENVGRGPSVASIHDALVASPEHYKNLTDPGFQSIGVGVVNTNGTFYVSEVFMESASQPAPSASAPRAATPSPGPQPVHPAPAAAPAPPPPPPPPVFTPAKLATPPDPAQAPLAKFAVAHHLASGTVPDRVSSGGPSGGCPFRVTRRGTRTAAPPHRGSARAARRARSWFRASCATSGRDDRDPRARPQPEVGGRGRLPIEGERQQAVGVDEQHELATASRPRRSGPSGPGARCRPSAPRSLSPGPAPSRASSSGSMLSWQLPNRSTHQTSPDERAVLLRGAATRDPGVSETGSISSPRSATRDPRREVPAAGP